MPDIAVVVVAFRSSATLGDCLTSILADPGTRVVVVDNASDPVTRRLCGQVAADHAGRLKYDDPRLNLGYAKACNRGLAGLAPSDLVAVVNPDVALERSLTELSEQPGFGPGDVIAGRLVVPNEPTAVNARPPVTIARELTKALLGSRSYRQLNLRVADGGLHEVGQLDGAMLLMHTSTWRAVGGFDERFELYYEDVDLCARIRESGRCLLANSRWGSHVGGHSFRHSDGRAFVALRVSRTRYALKWWLPRWHARAAVLLITAVELLTRSLTRQPEGRDVRSLAVRRVHAELRDPGSQHVLLTRGTSGID